MIKVVRQQLLSPVQWHYYRIAGQCVAFGEQVSSLSAFCVDILMAGLESNATESEGVSSRGCRPSNIEILNEQTAELYYQGEVKFHNQLRIVKYWCSRDIAQIDVDGEPSCILDFALGSITILNDLPFDHLFNLELITGPALILLLAQKSVFCLHASAVTVLSTDFSSSVSSEASNSINIAFIAESGFGKSTLSKSAGAQWMQCSDDILPIMYNESLGEACAEDKVCENGSSLKLYRDFPQLKLSNNIVLNGVTENNDLKFIFNITSDDVDEVVFEKVSSVKALLTFVRHTVAANLFSSELLQQHIEFAQKAVKSTQVYQLSYPRDLTQLPHLQNEIRQFVDAKLRVTTKL